MGLEIERKFIVKKDVNFADSAIESLDIEQGYLSVNPDATVRVRVMGEKGFITVKSRNAGAVRGEWEYEIPPEDAREMLSLRGVKSIYKTRYKIEYKGLIWEVDVFHKELEGLVLAEVELEREDQEFEVPAFVNREVTDDPRYYNSNLLELDSVRDLL